MVRLVYCLLVLLLSAVAHAHGSVVMRARQAVEIVLGTESSSQSARSLVPKASVVPTYDADGNLLHDGGRQFTRDAQNRLTQVETDLAALPAGAPAFRVSFGYDDLGRRIWHKAEGRVGGAWQVVQVRLFVYHGWNVVAEFDAASPATGSPRQLVQSYLWGTDLSGTPQGAGGVGGLLVLTDHRSGGTGSHGYAYDGNGNVLALVSLATGTISARYEYDPFGQPLGSSGPVSRLNPYRFSTKYTDSFTHLAYYGYRFYDPTAGRWLSRDPIGETGGMNLYGMLGNDPVNGIDFLGLAPNQAEVATLEQLIASVDEETAKLKLETCDCDIGDLMGSLSKKHTGPPRYLNTKLDGWIDLKHFFAAADIAEDWGSSAAEGLGYGVEAWQDVNEEESAWSYEDLPSNRAGAEFGDSYEGESCDGFKSRLRDFLNKRGIRDPRMPGTGYDSLPPRHSPGTGGSASGVPSNSGGSGVQSAGSNSNSGSSTSGASTDLNSAGSRK